MSPRIEVPTLTDGVVTLRRHTDDDIDRIVEQSLDPGMVRWTTIPSPYSRDDAKRFVREAMPGGWETDEEWGFAVDHARTFAGTVSLRNRGQRRAEIAYGAHPDARGTGVMERALRLLLDWGLSTEGRDLETVIWYAYLGNWASRRLAWKVGFDCSGTLRGWVDHRGELVDVWAGTLRRGDELRPRYRWLESPVIELDGLRLRPQREDDVAAIVAACADPECVRWMHQDEPPTEDQVRANALQAQSEQADGTTVRWAIADPATDALIGVVNIFDIDERATGSAEVGYWVAPQARGRGVATAATRAAVRHGFVDRDDGGLGLGRVRAIVGVDNAASCAVLDRVGFRPAGVLRDLFVVDGSPMDAAVYDLLATDPLSP